MAIKIPFVSDVAAFLRGTKDMEEGLEDVQDALDDLGRNTSTEKLEADLKAVGTEADAAAEKLETSFSSAFDKLKAEGRTATQRVKRDVDDVGDGAFKEFRDEGKQNLAESVSSFRGDAESAVEGVQATFGGLATALGPAGVVGAALVAAGIGVVRGMAEKAQEAAQAVADKATDMASSLAEGIPPAKILNDELKELAETATTRGKFFWAEASTGLRDLVDQAKDANIEVGKFLQAASGTDAKATQEELAKVQERIAAINEEINRADPQMQSGLLNRYAGELGKLDKAAETLGTQLKEQQAAVAAYNATIQYGPTVTEELTTSTSGLADSMAAAAKAAQDENAALAEQAELTGTAKESLWDVKDALDGVAAARKDNGKALTDNTAKGRENQRAIKEAVDAINDYGDAQIAAGASTTDTNAKLKAQEDALINKVMKAFGLTKTQAQKYIETLGGIPERKDTDVNVSDNGTAKTTQDKVDGITGKDVSVVVKPDMSYVDDTIRSYFNGKTFAFNVYARPGQAVGV